MAEVIRMPRMSDTMTEGVIVAWLKKVGDAVKSGDVLAEVETDKATMELESYNTGVLLYIGVEAGKAVQVDGVLAVIGKAGEEFESLLKASANGSAPKAEPAADAPASAPLATAAAPAAATATVSDGGRIKASPLAKKMAKDKGISLSGIIGSGEGGRVIKKDIDNYKGAPSATAFAAPAPQGGYEDVAVTQMRKTIARRLAESKFSAPHFYLTIDIVMDEAIAVRKRVNEFLENKISFNDIVIKAASEALKKHPKVNASWLGDKIRYYHYVNIGVAIAVDEGLVVPVIRNADTKKLGQISAEVRESADKARNKKLQPADFEGNTFTISNLGMFGIEEFTAIINPPDACIMAVGAIRETVIVEKGVIKPGNRMKVTLSCDHRVVDGAMGAAFLQTFKQYMEDPVIILA